MKCRRRNASMAATSMPSEFALCTADRASKLRRSSMMLSSAQFANSSRSRLCNGASVCAIRDGESIDTSMGFTPMEGLVMGTRAGDLDPGAILYLLRNGRADLDDLLNHQSGLRGISGISGDVRELEVSSDPNAQLALDVFAYRAAKYIASYCVALDGVDAIAFTAGIGEHSASMRQRICDRLAFLGVIVDDAANRAPRTDERRISSGSVGVWVIPTNEELEIARATYEVVLHDRIASRA